MKPIVEKWSDTDWKFIHPKDIDNEKTYNEYLRALDCLDNDNLEAEKLLKALIKRHPFYIDAYNHLSITFSNLKKRFESHLTAEKSYNIGKNCLPRTFKIGRDKLIWSNHENRPFLRACQIYGLECQDAGDFRLAIKLYDELLALNEGDNQGIRYLKLESLFAQKDFKGVKKHIAKYGDDWSIEFTYGKVAVAIIESDYEVAEKLLVDAINSNQFLSAEIIKTRHKAPPPFRLPGEPRFDAGNPEGSIQEAFDYWERNKALYKRKDIIDFYKNYNE